MNAPHDLHASIMTVALAVFVAVALAVFASLALDVLGSGAEAALRFGAIATGLVGSDWEISWLESCRPKTQTPGKQPLLARD